MSSPLAGPGPLIDVHAHFLHAACGKADWQRINARRLEAGDRIGVGCHVASILGSWGHTSPLYLSSPADVTAGNDAMFALQRVEGARVRAYAHVNPNDTGVALAELARCVRAGAVGVKIAAARRADDRLLDPICEFAAAHGLPVLHHLWQHRMRHWPAQDISDATDLSRLAARHPGVSFIAAHISGGGDWQHSLPAAADTPNVLYDLSGSGVDRGMLDDCVKWLGAERLLWAADLTMETALAKLRALQVVGLGAEDLALIRWRNAVRIFPPGTFGALERDNSAATA